MKELYENFVKKPLNMVDSGDLFKKGFFLILKLLAIATVVFGLYSIISSFGNYFNSFKGMGGFLIIRSILTFIFTFIISLVAYLAIALIFWKYGDDFKNEEYSGIALISSRFIKMIGQIIAVLCLSIGVTFLFTAIFAGRPFIPFLSLLQPFVKLFFGQASGFLAGLGFAAGIRSAGDYFLNLLRLGVLGFVGSVILSFAFLVIFYLFAELYEIVLCFLLRKQVFKK